MSSVLGAWSDPFDWPLIGVHTILTPDGKVLTFGTDQDGMQGGFLYYDVWDPVTNTHQTLDNTTATDTFCSVPALIPATDEILISGGDARPLGETNFGVRDVNIFDYRDLSMEPAATGTMTYPRWYPTAVTLASGQIVLLGGRLDEGGLDDGIAGQGTPYPEIYTPGVGFEVLEGAAHPVFASDWWYPRAWLASNGDIIVVGSRESDVLGPDGTPDGVYSMDPTGDGSITQVVPELPFDTAQSTPAILYAPDQVLFLSFEGELWTMDIGGAVPTFQQVGALGKERLWSDMVVLADGSVMISGGSGEDPEKTAPIVVSHGNTLHDVTPEVAIWDPRTGEVTIGAEENTPRLYHSTTILLPDATVLSLGGGAPGPLTNLNGEIYTPTYLFDDDGTLAERPVIIDAPSMIDAGDTFTITLDDAADIERLTFVKHGSTTHSLNMETRAIELSFSDAAGDGLTVTAPSDHDVLSPGYWMLFAFDAAGTPSVAATIKVDIEGGGAVAPPGGAVEPPPQLDDPPQGTAGDDVLIGGDGDDTMRGGGGSDVIEGGGGDDRLGGGRGDDLVDGGAGSDAVFGGKQNDVVRGGDGDDFVYGNPGRDSLGGGAGADLLTGGWGRDWLWGGAGDDILRGNGGADVLHGGGGNDRLAGGWGLDLYVIAAGDGGTDWIFGFNPQEKIRFDGFGRTDAEIAASVASDGERTTIDADDDGTADVVLLGFTDFGTDNIL